MFKQTFVALLLTASSAVAENSPIYGSVESKCSIHTDRQGVYAQPTPDELTTVSTNGGVTPKIRYDVSLADYYLAKISWPQNFTSSPSLSDIVTWDGSVEVAEVTDPLMSGYESAKIKYNNITEFNLTESGTVWFGVTSTVNYGYGKAFPGGNYMAVVTAECIAK